MVLKINGLPKVKVHLIVEDPDGIIGGGGNQQGIRGGSVGKRYRAVCNAKAVPTYRTNLASATTCPECLAHDDFKKVFAEQHGVSDDDMPEPETPPANP